MTYSREEEKPMADNGQKIIDLDKKRMHAMAQKDIATLNALLSNDLVYTHSTAWGNLQHAQDRRRR
jgi:hypothetical protein